MTKAHEYFPWHEVLWQGLVSRGELPHAFLFSGQVGLGKLQFAKAFAYYQMCSSKTESKPCLRCHTCELMLAGTHPDMQVIEGEGAANNIKIERIRELVEWSTKSSQFASKKIAIIHPADKMNIASSNALLKTLEEPAANMLFLLITDYPALLPATIKSRCQQLHFKPSFDELTIAWLKRHLAGEQDAERLLYISGGSPLSAIALSKDGHMQMRQTFFEDIHAVLTHREDPVNVAEVWHKHNLLSLIDMLMTWAVDLSRLQAGGVASNQDITHTLFPVVSGVSSYALYKFYDRLLESKRMLLAGMNPNAQLLLENVMIEIAGLTSRAKRAVA